MADRGKITEAINKFETDYSKWSRYEILGGFGQSFRIYDTEKDEYIPFRRAKSFIRDFMTVLKPLGLTVMPPVHNSREVNKNAAGFGIVDEYNLIESGYENIAEDIEDRFGQYITKLSVSANWETKKPFIKFYYLSNVTDEIRKEIYEYITTTYQNEGKEAN